MAGSAAGALLGLGAAALFTGTAPTSMILVVMLAIVAGIVLSAAGALVPAFIAGRLPTARAGRRVAARFFVGSTDAPEEVPPAGLEPATLGLKGRCSTVELRGRSRFMVGLRRDPQPAANLQWLIEPPWSSGLGRRPFTPEIAGSNPAGGTTTTASTGDRRSRTKRVYVGRAECPVIDGGAVRAQGRVGLAGRCGTEEWFGRSGSGG